MAEENSNKNVFINNFKIGIAIMAYNRPKHLKKLFQALKEQNIKEFYVFIDGTENKSIKDNQKNIENLIKDINWAKVTVIKRIINLGLKRSIVTAVSEILNKYEAIILLEDDTIPVNGFFEFTIQNLHKFKSDNSIRSISGYQIPSFIKSSNIIKPVKSSRFIPWGWATWRDRWIDYEPNLDFLIDEINIKDKYKELPSDLKKYLSRDKLFLKNNDIWSVNWVLAHFLTNSYSIMPSQSLIHNIGFDGTGVHCGQTDEFNQEKDFLEYKIDLSENYYVFSQKNNNKINSYMENKWLKTMDKRNPKLSKILEINELKNCINQIVNDVNIIDIHTHLFPPEFNSFRKSGFTELLTYHYLTTELLSGSDIDPKKFFQKSKKLQAEIIWQDLFIEKTPFSEASLGVLTILKFFNINCFKKTFDEIEKEFNSCSSNIEYLFNTLNIKKLVMTNNPFNNKEWELFSKDNWDKNLYLSSIRIDEIFFNKNNKFRVNYEKNGFKKEYLVSFNKFLEKIYTVSDPKYFALSLDGDQFKNILKDKLFTEVLIKFLIDRNIPLSLMLGVKRNVNTSFKLGGDGLGQDGLLELEYLAKNYPALKIFTTHLDNSKHQRIVVLSRKFRNISIFGFWWFNNQRSLIKQGLKLRFELLGHNHILQHSDARVDEQLIYKWVNFKEIFKEEIFNVYKLITSNNWEISNEKIEKDIINLFETNPNKMLS